MSEYVWVALANLVVALHLGYIAFVAIGLVLIVIGALAGWRWTRRPLFRLLHLLAVGIVALETVAGITCPLTDLENYFRDLGGQESLEGDFIGRMLRNVVFIRLEEGHWVFHVMYIGTAGLVLVAWWLFPPYWKSADQRGKTSA